MDRRTLIQGIGATLALGSVAGGVAVTRNRSVARRESDRIIGPWPELGMNANWLLPDLHDAHMVVVDRPHRAAEARDLNALRQMKRVRSFSVNTSAGRLRLPEGEGGKRIVCVGDSVTFGWGVEDEETWPHLLARRLGAGFHTLNAGVPGQPLAPMRNFLARFGPTLAPDIALVARRMPPQELPTPRGFQELVAAARKANPNMKLGLVLPPAATFDPHGQRAWAQEQATLRKYLPDLPILELTPRFRAAAKGMPGVRLDLTETMHRVVDNESGALRMEAPAPPQEMDDRIYALFEEDASVREPLFFDTGHPDEEGLKLFADEVANWLEDLGWLQ